MRQSVVIAAVLLVVAGAAGIAPASTFHFMQVEKIIGGVGGDATAQAIQLRMRADGQNLLNFSRIRVWDATGATRVLVVEPGSSVPNGSLGSRVLIASAAFASKTTPAAVPDFVMTNLIPESFLAAGSLTFEDASGTTVYWRVSWGGGAYSGLTTGSVLNDADGEYGPPYAGSLPSSAAEALVFQGVAAALSTANNTDYALSGGAAVVTNNAGASFTVDEPPSAVAPTAALVELSQNYPNPFNPSTRIRFTLRDAARATLDVFDTGGRHVVTIFDGIAGPGVNEHEWNGRDASGRAVGSGIYYYRLVTARGEEVRKMLLLK